MIIKLKHLALINCLLFSLMLALDAFAGRPPPNPDNCARSWRLTAATTDLAFGEFSIDSGSGSVNLSSGGARTALGDIGLSSGLPFNTFQLQFDNRQGVACLGFPFNINWITAPSPLVGPGTDLPLNVYVYEPTIAPTVNATLPIAVPANSGLTLPFTMTFYGDISATFAQTAGAYLSGNMRVAVYQGTNLKRGPVFLATATSITPITLLETIPMDFGTIAGSSTSSTVTLNPASGRTGAGGAQIMATGPGTAATFQLTGNPNLTYIVSFISGILENPAGQQMTITTFTNNSLGTIPAGGVETFQVGATLNLNPAQPAGVYSTTTGGGSPYTMTVNYN
jgi:hypothetical protein